MTNDEIRSKLNNLEKELQAQIDLYVLDRFRIEAFRKRMEEKEHIILEEPHYVDSNFKFVTLSDVNKRIIYSINGYCARRSALITEFRNNGAVMTGQGDNEYIVWGDGYFESKLGEAKHE